jgi:hypothetical protein
MTWWGGAMVDPEKPEPPGWRLATRAEQMRWNQGVPVFFYGPWLVCDRIAYFPLGDSWEPRLCAQRVRADEASVADARVHQELHDQVDAEHGVLIWAQAAVL